MESLTGLNGRLFPVWRSRCRMCSDAGTNLYLTNTQIKGKSLIRKFLEADRQVNVMPEEIYFRKRISVDFGNA